MSDLREYTGTMESTGSPMTGGVRMPSVQVSLERRPTDQHVAFDRALQILATWAVRAAHRAQNEPASDPASLDFAGSQSDVSPCLRNRSGSPTTAGGNQ